MIRPRARALICVFTILATIVEVATARCSAEIRPVDGEGGDWGNSTTGTPNTACPTNWICAVQCKATKDDLTLPNTGKCGSGVYSDYLDDIPCAGGAAGDINILKKFAGCDYKVCADACAGLSVTADLPWANTTYQGSTYHCFNSSHANSISASDADLHPIYTAANHSDLADEASIAYGCSHISATTHPGASYSITGCYTCSGYSCSFRFNASSPVEQADFCYGGKSSSGVCLSHPPPPSPPPPPPPPSPSSSPEIGRSLTFLIVTSLTYAVLIN